MKANNIMERTVVEEVPTGDCISRGNFLPALRNVIGPKNLVVLGIAGSNQEWHITTSDVTHAHSLVDCGSIEVGRESASLSFFPRCLVFLGCLIMSTTSWSLIGWSPLR